MTIYDPEVATDEELSHPDFENAGKVHDWRNHVGRETKALWPTFSAEQRRAIALDAGEQASNELWD